MTGADPAAALPFAKRPSAKEKAGNRLPAFLISSAGRQVLFRL
jgi:hypothetical protein